MENKPDIFDRIMSLKIFSFFNPFYVKYKKVLLYIFFGGASTIINVVTHYVLYNILHIPNIISDIIAWIVSVFFSFVTHSEYVFEKGSSKDVHKLKSFYQCRITTGLVDVLIMFVCVDLLQMNSLVIKIICNLLVGILNFFASKFIVFKKEGE